MKHFLPTFALLISSLFAPVAVSAQPNICNGPSGLVYVPTFTCQAANVGVFSGLTVGNCLVIEADLSIGTGTCGGGGGGSNFPTGITTGVPGIDGPFAVVASLGGPVSFTTDSTTCLVAQGTCGSDLLITDSNSGPIVAIDSGGDIESAGSIISASGIVEGSSSAYILISNNAGAGGYYDVGGMETGCSASMCLKRPGPPTGACTTGSFYTNALASSLTTVLYVCEASTWHAVTVP